MALGYVICFINSSPVSVMTEHDAGAVLFASFNLSWLYVGVVLAVYMFVYLGRVTRFCPGLRF